MLLQEQNERLCSTGPGTPGGIFLRCYWQPVTPSAELPPDGAPLTVRLLGEDLVLFRDDQGRPGLLGLRCSHRCADLSYGRVEDGGLRCLYHGWLYDINGRCLEQPAEPADSTFKDKIQHTAYPCREKGGFIFAYMGAGEPPQIPSYEFLEVPEEQRWITKVYHDCNYIQGNEGNFDPVHTSYVHRLFGDSDWTKRKSKAVVGSDLTPNSLYSADAAPQIETEETDFGIRIYILRNVGDKFYRRITNFILPNLSAVPGQTGGEGYTVNWHVPIDDNSHWKYRVMFSREKPLDREHFRQQDEKEITPDHRLKRNGANRYLQDREEMNTKSFSGIGPNFQVHDAWATESQGPIQDRTAERLATSDKAIIAVRRKIVQAIAEAEAGRKPDHVILTEAENRLGHMVSVADVIPQTDDWRTSWHQYADVRSYDREV